ncbi:MAG TPA: 6-carboxytetrahydropterin synthase, partial [Candidatus Kryptonia bacterium]|nr:6-carboxytetrahydropterin synthase [Candidatus Kryptonia bacterium]
GFREALHGHNYRVSVEVEGQLGPNGYVVDFGVVKKVARRVCERLNEKTLVPLRSDCLTIEQAGDQIVMRYEGDEFRFPRADAALLPIIHSSAEELARYLAGELRRELRADGIDDIQAIQIGVEETTGQAAYYREEA